MNPTKEYNPCDHPLGAKIWECLRRNPSFRRAISLARGGSSRPRRSTMGSKRRSHPIVAALWKCATCNNIVGRFEDSDWPSLPLALQETLQSLVERKWRVSNLTGAILAAPSRVALLSKTHRIIAVPREVPTPKEARRIAEEVAQTIGFRFRTQDYEPKGATFGSPQKWRHYLLAERFSLRRGKLDEGGIKVATYLGPWPERSQECGASARGEILDMFGSHLEEGQVENVRKDCKKIKSLIESIFEDISVLAYDL